MKKKNIIFLFFILLILIILFSLFYGSVKVPVKEIIKIILNKFLGLNFEIEKQSYIPIIYNVRLPRVFTAVIVGGALGISGCTMQSLLKNPIVDSGIVGISSGASLGAVLAITFGLSGKYIFVMPIFSITVALLIAFLVYRLALLKGKVDNLLLVLSGIAINSFIGAIISLILINLMEGKAKEYIFWSVGSLSGIRWEHFHLAVFPIIFLSLVLMYYGKELNILLLGDEESKALGVDIKNLRKKILVVISFLTAISVCISGNIGFVGLIVPHILRKILGSDNRYLLKSSFLIGAFFMTFCDLISRTIFSPRELGVGIVTAILGSPYFIYLLIKVRKGGQKL